MDIKPVLQNQTNIYSSGLIEKSKNLSKLEKIEKDSIKELSQEFESIFLQIMLKSMRDSVQKSGLINEGSGERIFEDMLDGEYAKIMSSQTQSGLAEAIERQLLGLRAEPPKTLVHKPEALARYKSQQID